jgi:hypothetical protein
MMLLVALFLALADPAHDECPRLRRLSLSLIPRGHEGKQMKFKPDNEYAKLGGHARRGTRNKLDTFCYGCALAHAQHKRKLGDPPAEYADTNLWAALDTTFKQNPRDYTGKIISMLAKQVSFENVTDLAETDRLIEAIREELAAREERALEAPQMKVIDHVVN